MNVLFLTLMYPNETLNEVTACSRNGLQNQINNYQRALVKGLDDCLKPPEAMRIVNALPVGTFPNHYSRLFLSGGIKDGRIYELKCINLPWFKQKQREKQAENAILKWASENGSNRTLLLYTLYLPYLKAVARAKRKIPGLRATAIVTDLPNEWGLSSGRKGIMKRIEHALGLNQLTASSALDGYVLLTEPMSEVLPSKPHIVMEGLILNDIAIPQADAAPTRPVALYTGTLSRELGIDTLLEAFAEMPEYELWLCGKGDMVSAVERYARQHENIRYYGFVSQHEALRLQAAATVLVNPRSPQGLFTRYSFPSKTLEYMRSGKPVLCHRLEGIPSDYDAYLSYIQGEGPEALERAVKAVFSMDDAARARLGAAAREYVCVHKSPQMQCAKIIEFLRALLI